MSAATIRRTVAASIAASILACAAATRTAGAQTLDRSIRPTPGAPTTFHFPTVRSHVLANGMRVLIAPDHSIPVVAVRVVIDADSTDDPPGKEGLYDVTLNALREGTTTRSADALARASATLGTAIAPTAFTTTTANFQSALAIMGEMLMHPLLDSTGIERRKLAQAAAASAGERRAFHTARTLFYTALYGADDPITRSIDAPERSVQAITRDDVIGFYHQHVRPATTTIIVTGDVSDADALAALRREFGSWPAARATVHASTRPAVTPRSTTILLHDIPGSAAYIYVGHAGPTRTAPDAAAAEMMGAIATTELQQRLRERRGLVYNVSGGMVWHAVPGPSEFLNATQTRPTAVDTALVEWFGALRGLRGTESVTAAALHTAQESRIGALPVKIDGPDSVATRLVEIVRDRLPLDYFDRYVAGISATTPADVTASAAKYVDLDHLVIVVTGDRRIIEPALRAAKLAPVVLVDEDGRPLADSGQRTN